MNLQFVNEEEVTEAFQDVRNDASSTNWAMMTYENSNSMILMLNGKGSEGINEMTNFLQEDIVAYCLVRLVDVIDETRMFKFVFIKWIGEKVPRMQRAKTGVQRFNIEEFIGQFHIEYTCSNLSELNPETVMEKIMGTSGTASKVLNEEGKKKGSEQIAHATVSQKSSSSISRNAVRGELTFGNINELEKAIHSVRDDNDETNWVLSGYSDNRTIVLVGCGIGGISEMKELLKENKVCYGLVRKTERVDESDTVKFVFIKWLPENVPRMLKACLGTHSGAVNEIFSPYHMNLDCSTLDEISDEIIESLMSRTSGTASHVLAETRPTEKVTKGAGFTSSTSSNKSEPKISSRGGPSVPLQLQSISLSDEGLLLQGISDVRNDESDIKWVIGGYKQGTQNKVEFIAKGSGSIDDELPQYLQDDIVIYGLVRFIHKIDDSITIKFCFIKWIGENIPRMLRAKLGTHSGSIKQIFSPYHYDICCSQKSEISEAIVNDLVQINYREYK